MMAEHTRLAEFRKHMEEKMNSDFHDLVRDLSECWAQEAQHREEQILARIAAMMEERHSELARERSDNGDLRIRPPMTMVCTRLSKLEFPHF